jgi:hypothetical protein
MRGLGLVLLAMIVGGGLTWLVLSLFTPVRQLPFIPDRGHLAPYLEAHGTL